MDLVWTGIISLVVAVAIVGIHEKLRIVGIVIGAIVFVLISIFVAFPHAKKAEAEAIRNAERRASVRIEVIEECIQDYLDENGLHLDNGKVKELAEYIYKKRLYVETEDDFYVKDKFLEELKIILQPAPY